MNQFNFIFTTTRIPELNLDILKFNKSSWNLLVISQNQYFTFSLMDPRSQLLLTEEEIQIQIERILNLSSNYPKPPITPGILTCGNRNECAQARKKWLEKAPSLASLFQLVEEAPFVVCLDENEPKTTQEALCHVACGDANNRFIMHNF